MSPLSKASQSARSPFLKAESFRLLSLLLSTTPNAENSETERKAAAAIEDAQEVLLTSFLISLKDEEMKKTKRARALLKALDKFLNSLKSCSADSFKKLDDVKNLLSDFGDSDSSAMKGACAKLAAEIDTKMAELKVETETSVLGITEDPSSSTKKKKKKKKKR